MISQADHAPRTELDIFLQVVSLNPPNNPMGEGRYVHFTDEKTLVWRIQGTGQRGG